MECTDGCCAYMLRFCGLLRCSAGDGIGSNWLARLGGEELGSGRNMSGLITNFRGYHKQASRDDPTGGELVRWLYIYPLDLIDICCTVHTFFWCACVLSCLHLI